MFVYIIGKTLSLILILSFGQNRNKISSSKMMFCVMFEIK
jgi:hypothetical protein